VSYFTLIWNIKKRKKKSDLITAKKHVGTASQWAGVSTNDTGLMSSRTAETKSQKTPSETKARPVRAPEFNKQG